MNPTMRPTTKLIATVWTLILLLFGAGPAFAQNYTISPPPFPRRSFRSAFTTM